MSTFDEVFERIKVSTNTRTQVELAEVLDIRQSSISDAKRRNSVPSDWYMKLFEKFGLNPDWLKHAKGPMYLKTEEGYEPFDGPPLDSVRQEAAHYSDPDSKGAIVTVHSMQCKGSEEEGWEPKKIGKLSIPQSYAKASILVLKMESSSMEPLVRRGAFLGLDTEQKNIVSGELYGLYVPYEGLSIKRIFFDAEKNRFILRTENASHPEQHLPAENLQDRIVGRAVWVLQGL